MRVYERDRSPQSATPSRCPIGMTSLFLHYIFETKDSEKPDGLRFVREAQFERFGNGLITPRIRVRTLYKGAWKEKAPFQVP
jgi:hypothetical protein